MRVTRISRGSEDARRYPLAIVDESDQIQIHLDMGVLFFGEGTALA
jgi:hypothetical protein